MPVLDEFGLIRLLTGRGAVPGSGVAVGVGDDAAVLNGRSGFQWVVSCDTMVRDIHFKPETMTWVDIGFKVMASNISDMAAMGAVPRFALVALSVPKEVTEEQLVELYDGLYECAGLYGVEIVGGDTTSCPKDTTVSVTVIGEAEQDRALLRSGVKPGDVLFVTGPLGLSAAGLDVLLKRGGSAYDVDGIPPELLMLVRAHQRPKPQVAAGRLLLAAGLGHGLNDISDGLASEAWELAEASSCLLELEEELLPMPQQLRDYALEAGLDPLELVLYGGEDYQLVGAVAADAVDKAALLFQQAGLGFIVVGRAASVGSGTGVRLLKVNGEAISLEKRGYNHFRAGLPNSDEGGSSCDGE